MSTYQPTSSTGTDPLGAGVTPSVGSSGVGSGGVGTGSSATSMPRMPTGTSTSQDDRSLGDLLKDLRNESSTLIRQEVALAKTEMGEKAARYGKDAASIGLGAAVALVGAFALINAVAYVLAAILNLGLDLRWPNALWISWLIVGLVTGITGYLLLNRGLSDLKRQSPVPEKTIQSLKEDKQWLANKTH